MAIPPPNCYEVAEANLEAAVGVPGSVPVDVAACLRWVDDATRLVRHKTERYFYQFKEHPEEFDHSEGVFRMMSMATVLQRDLGVHYRQEVIDLDDHAFFSDAANLFIHGIIHGNGGTCSSMPALYAAVGRRLGYPIKIVRCKRHAFARWEGPRGECFNIESTSRGFVSHPDAYYLHWPTETKPEEVVRYKFFESMTPHEEVASFVGMRGHVFYEHGRYGDAVDQYLESFKIAPDCRGALDSLEHTTGRWGKELRSRLMPGFPGLSLGPRPTIHSRLPEDTQNELHYCRVVEALLEHPPYEQRWWKLMREAGNGQRPPGLPEWLDVSFSPDGKLSFRKGVRPPSFNPGLKVDFRHIKDMY